MLPFDSLLATHKRLGWYLSIWVYQSIYVFLTFSCFLIWTFLRGSIQVKSNFFSQKVLYWLLPLQLRWLCVPQESVAVLRRIACVQKQHRWFEKFKKKKTMTFTSPFKSTSALTLLCPVLLLIPLGLTMWARYFPLCQAMWLIFPHELLWQLREAACLPFYVIFC